MKRLVHIMVCFCVLASSSVTHALVIGDFENEQDDWAIWTYPGAKNEPIELSYSTTGATLNSYSLRLDLPPTVSRTEVWYQPLVLNIAGNEEMIEALMLNPTLAMDITFDPNDWTAREGVGTWASFKAIFNSQNGAWDDQGPPQTDSGNPDVPGGWDPINFPNVHTRHVTWDFSDTYVGEGNLDPGGWCEIILEFQFDPNFAGAVFYIDNVQFAGVGMPTFPVPDNGESDITIEPTLSWTAGGLAEAHTLYFGADFDDVNNATVDAHPNVLVVDPEVASVPIDQVLAFYTTYYWRVDASGADKSWRGDVWQFTTGGYEMVEDFESYVSTSEPGANRIFEAWRDQYEFTNPDQSKTPGNGTNMTVGVATAPYGPERDIVYKGKQSLPLTFDNSYGVYYSETDRTFEPTQDWTVTHNGLPLESLIMQVHGVWKSPGTFTYDGGNQYTVTGSGIDISGTEDGFHYVYQALPADGSIVARVVSADDVHEWAKVGVMIREGLEPDALMAAAFVTNSGHLEYMYRDFVGDTALGYYTDANEIELPHWVRLTRSGTIITAEHSANGNTWEPFGDNSTVSISMFDDVYIGLAVTSHVDAGTPNTAVFSNVAVEGTAGNVFTDSVDVGLSVNDPADLYVTIVDGSNVAATYNHPDNPDAVLNYEWLPFSIPLSAFSNGGVDLTQVKTMIIGIGDEQPGGAGKLYVDDIRLSLPQPADPNEAE